MRVLNWDADLLGEEEVEGVELVQDTGIGDRGSTCFDLSCLVLSHDYHTSTCHICAVCYVLDT